MSTQTISVAAAALGVGWGIGLVYPGSDLPSYTYYASPLELPLTLIALGLALCCCGAWTTARGERCVRALRMNQQGPEQT